MTAGRLVPRGAAAFTAAALAMVLAGCNGDDDGASTTIATATTEESVTTTAATTTPPTTTTTVAETTTTTPTTTTTTAPTPTSPPTAEQTDWIPIVEDLYARKATVAAEPERIAEIAVEGQPAYDEIFSSATGLAAEGLHLEVDPLDVVRVDLVRVTNAFPDGSPAAVTLIIWKQPQTGRGAVDAAGNVVIPLGVSSFPVPEGALPRNNISIRRFSPEEAWRFEDDTEIAPAVP